MGELDRRRHQLRRLAAGKAEHQPLVAGPLVLVADGVDPHRDVGRLGVQQDLDLRPRPVKARLLVADVAHRVARQLLDVRSWVIPSAPRTSPAMMMRLVVASVSTATRAAGLALRKASRMVSEIRSQILSGCPSATDSLVNR